MYVQEILILHTMHNNNIVKRHIPR